MKDKEIRLTIINGKLEGSSSTDADYSNRENTYSNTHTMGLKEIAVVIETLKKEQEKIMNKQKDEANKLRVRIGKSTPYKAIQLPNDAPLSLVIRLLNDMHLDITRDDCKVFWNKYKATIHTLEIGTTDIATITGEVKTPSEKT